MRLKRQYDPAEIEAWKAAGKPPESTPKPTHVVVQRHSQFQKFDPGMLQREVAAGTFSMGKGKISVHTAEGEPDLVFKILRAPGLFCCHCDRDQADSKTAALHVATEHPNTESPDPNNPAGYRQDNFFFCEVEG